MSLLVPVYRATTDHREVERERERELERERQRKRDRESVRERKTGMRGGGWRETSEAVWIEREGWRNRQGKEAGREREREREKPQWWKKASRCYIKGEVMYPGDKKSSSIRREAISMYVSQGLISQPC